MAESFRGSGIRLRTGPRVYGVLCRPYALLRTVWVLEVRLECLPDAEHRNSRSRSKVPIKVRVWTGQGIDTAMSHLSHDVVCDVVAG